jgi:hypothetical protein
MTGVVKIKDMTPEQKKEYMKHASKRYYAKKKDEIIERNLKYYYDNKETMLPKIRTYYWDHRDEYCEMSKIRRELKKMAEE